MKTLMLCLLFLTGCNLYSSKYSAGDCFKKGNSDEGLPPGFSDDNYYYLVVFESSQGTQIICQGKRGLKERDAWATYNLWYGCQARDIGKVMAPTRIECPNWPIDDGYFSDPEHRADYECEITKEAGLHCAPKPFVP